MKITIIHKDDCPLCETAIREFTGDGHEVELHRSLSEITDKGRRCDMMADLLSAGGDKDAYPCVFIYDRFTPWQPKSK
jgi:hypothetical protein